MECPICFQMKNHLIDLECHKVPHLLCIECLLVIMITGKQACPRCRKLIDMSKIIRSLGNMSYEDYKAMFPGYNDQDLLVPHLTRLLNEATKYSNLNLVTNTVQLICGLLAWIDNLETLKKKALVDALHYAVTCNNVDVVKILFRAYYYSIDDVYGVLSNIITTNRRPNKRIFIHMVPKLLKAQVTELIRRLSDVQDKTLEQHMVLTYLVTLDHPVLPPYEWVIGIYGLLSLIAVRRLPHTWFEYSMYVLCFVNDIIITLPYAHQYPVIRKQLVLLQYILYVGLFSGVVIRMTTDVTKLTVNVTIRVDNKTSKTFKYTGESLSKYKDDPLRQFYILSQFLNETDDDEFMRLRNYAQRSSNRWLDVIMRSI